MTHARPMFPPRADRAKTCQVRLQVSTCTDELQVETLSSLNSGNSAVEQSGGADAAPRRETPAPRCSTSASRDSLNLGGAGREPPKNAVPTGSSIPSAVPIANSTRASPDGALDGPFVRTDISPEELLKALGRLRREAEAEIERLIDLLDDIGPDPDLEPAGDELEDDAAAEPSLASPEHHPSPDFWSLDDRPTRSADGTQVLWGANGNSDDREQCADMEEDDSHDGREPDVCDEPILGSFDRLLNQDHGWRQTGGNDRTWILHRNNDYEVDHDGREPDAAARHAGRAR